MDILSVLVRLDFLIQQLGLSVPDGYFYVLHNPDDGFSIRRKGYFKACELALLENGVVVPEDEYLKFY